MEIINKNRVIAISVIVIIITFIYIKCNSAKYASNYFIPDQSEHDEMLKKINTDIKSLQSLEKVFGKGRLYIRYYQIGFNNPILVWEGNYNGKYEVVYEIQLLRSSDGSVQVDPKSIDIGHLLETVARDKMNNGRYLTTHGKYIEFTAEELEKWETNQKLLDIKIND